MDVELSSQPSQAPQAGRGDRVARTREAIVASTLTLAMEGEVAPIVRDIAKLAGVSARTVFQHFADTAELYVAVLGRVLATLANDPPANTGANNHGALDERISDAIGQRAGRYEKLVPMWTFVETLQRRSSEAGEKVNQLYASNREQLAQKLRPGMHVEFIVDPSTVSHRGVHTDAEPFRYVPNGGPVRHQRADFRPARAEGEVLDASHQPYREGFLMADCDADQAGT